jgi:hypothetical protein
MAIASKLLLVQNRKQEVQPKLRINNERGRFAARWKQRWRRRGGRRKKRWTTRRRRTSVPRSRPIPCKPLWSSLPSARRVPRTQWRKTGNFRSFGCAVLSTGFYTCLPSAPPPPQYTDETSQMLAQEALEQAGPSGRIGCLSTPSAFKALKVHATLLSSQGMQSIFGICENGHVLC